VKLQLPTAKAARRAVLLAGAVAVTVFAGTASAMGDVDTLRELNEQYIKAGIEQDKRWFERMLMEDFVCILSDGRVIDKTQFLALPGGSLSSSQLEDVKVRVHGDTGIVHARYAWAFADGKSGVTIYTDVYVRKSGQWRVASAQLTRLPPAASGK
jgi:hypothetical protein